MWVARNSISGEIYSPKFESIYECQFYIDENLFILEYELQRVKLLEEQAKNEIKLYGKTIAERIALPIVDFVDSLGRAIKNFDLNKVEDKSLIVDNSVKAYYLSNNIIRCFNLSQKRYANGFDF